MEVTSWGAQGQNEPIGTEYLRCYDIDDIISAIQNDYVLIDTSLGGNGNTYDFRCSKAAERKSEDEEGARFLAIGALSLVGYSMLYL